MTHLEIHPDYLDLLRAEGLDSFDALFAAGERDTVDGHRMRSVSRLELGGASAPGPVVIYLKRQWGPRARPSPADLFRLTWPRTPACREWHNMLTLLAAGIPVARPVAWGRSTDGGQPRALLAIRQVDGPSLARWLEQSRSAPHPVRFRRAVAEAVGHAVRKLHDAGFSFPDLYAKHLFLENLASGAPRVLLIDVQRLRRFLPWRAAGDLAALWVSSRNLGVARTDLLRVLMAYFGPAAQQTDLRRTIARIEARAARMPGRGQDPNLIEGRRTPPPGMVALADDRMVPLDGGRLHVAEAFLPAFRAAGLTTLDAIMGMTGGQTFRSVNGRSTVRVELADPAGGTVALYVKRYTRVPLKMQLRRTLSINPPVSQAMHELRGLVRLMDIGIPTMRRVAWGEELACRGRRERSCLITQEIAGAVQADVYCEHTFGGPPSREKTAARRRMVRDLARLARRLHAARLSHRDFYLCHVLVRPATDGDLVLHLIDLQRLTHHRRGLGARWVVKDLAAMLFSSWPSQATHIRSRIFTNTDRMRFALEYFGVRRLTAGQKRLLRRAIAKARSIARREAGRRAETRP